jgi:hypothetical protein
MKRIIFITLAFSMIYSIGFAQDLVINEFMATNNTGITDNYGEAEDWIEIYNSGTAAVNLGGMYFTDDLLFPFTFQLPSGNDSTILNAGEFLLLWADGDAEQGVLHIDIKLNGGGEQIGMYTSSGNIIDTITYLSQIPNVSFGRQPDAGANWVHFGNSTPEASNSTVNLALTSYVHAFPSSSGHTLNISVYSNINWNVASSETWITVNPVSGANNGAFTINVLTANPTATERSASIVVSGSGVSDQILEVFQFGQVTSPKLKINEFLSENDDNLSDNKGEFDDWIELYNEGNTPIDIGGMYITDDLNDPLKFLISSAHPDSTTIPAKGFMLLWADDDTEQGILHTNFKLSNNGEEIGVYINQYTVLDSIIYSQQYADTSYGRLWDGAAAWTYFNLPTPDASNANGIEEKENENDLFQAYPNPVNDILYIELDHHISVFKMYDLTGRILITEELEKGTNRVSMAGLLNGIYLLCIESEDQIHSQKIIKK